MKHFNHTNRNYGINGSRVLGISLATAGLIVLLIPMFVEVATDPRKVGLVGGGAILLGALLIAMSAGTELDFESSRFRKYHRIHCFKFGQWQDLPKIEAAKIIIHSFRSQHIPNGITPTMSGPVTLYKCVLLANDSQFLVFDYFKEKDAIAALLKIKAGVGI
ncbi:hypothetical protein [Algoriphagus terrigena]|uniref:hypothetical protein n=1 Tax=Algoriphagus terrigena TaxID=344884 RepID=UPI00042340E4|nr:hypothetical protein [Algoriphagus terrigena]